MGCDIPMVPKMIDGVEFQSTHPHGVRRVAVLVNLAQVVISIHAPAWGATNPEP